SSTPGTITIIDDRHRCERRAPAHEFEQRGVHRVEENGENRRPSDRRQKRRQDQECAVQNEQKKRKEKSGHEPSSIHRVASSPIRQLYVEELSVARRHKPRLRVRRKLERKHRCHYKGQDLW